MFYRRKIILSLLQLFDNKIDKISLQKLLFLFTKGQKKAEYDFIPYLYGCYSYSASADLTAMVSKGMRKLAVQPCVWLSSSLAQGCNYFIYKASTSYVGAH